ncbi:MAG: hypothetical protein H6818_03430 [Phycisphaerales bacterium]|nr:hypothetical protein [Phycisphaerales bacterium]
MRQLLLIILIATMSVLSACEPRVTDAPHADTAALPREAAIVSDLIISPLLEGFDDLGESGVGDEEISSDCSRWITRADGRRVCIDVLIAILMQEHPEDNDGDGIPNISDDDIDGDGIPNGYDLDVDGDGIPNSYDDDIDGDGVPNEDDVDIDGDFLRNRWDPDMDGDLIYNPHDRDADGDGKLKFPSSGEDDEPACGAADIFRDPDECDLDDCDDDSGSTKSVGARSDPRADTTGSGNKEGKCADKGKKKGSGSENGQNMPMDEMVSDPTEDPEEPTTTELAMFGEEIEQLFADRDVVEDLSDADPAATDKDVLDAAIESVEAAMEEDAPDTSDALVEEMGDAAKAAYAARRRSIAALTGTAMQSLSVANDITRMLSAAEKQLDATLDELTDTIVEVDGHLPGADILEDGAIAAMLHEVSDEADLPSGGVSAAVGPAARLSLMIDGDDDIESVWRSVVDRTSEHVDDRGGVRFSLPNVALAAERITLVLEDPTVDSVDESLDHLLDATDESELDDPLEVLDAMLDIAESDPSFSLSDGISEAEAERGAIEAMS